MSNPDKTFYNLKRLHAIFAVAALAMLGATVWMVVADHNREWKQYQRTFRDSIEPWMTEEKIAPRDAGASSAQADSADRQAADERLQQALERPRRSAGKWFLSLPFIDAFGRPLAIEQIWLPDLQINYNFCQVARFDRCTTCHQGIDKRECSHGLPHPYSAHPRMDLYVGSRSPHPLSEFGCTACHDGQGSATEFKFASHTPNDPSQRSQWRKEHGWFWNRDWDFPMRPKRFVESGCLKCHHEVTDLEASERFPDAPAPKLVAGYHLVRQLGCFGCHEINGAGEGGRPVGPDMRLEPNGTMRTVGPSLRDLASRMDAAAVAAWIGDPAGFRPSTRMPKLFGMHDHLEGPSLDAAQRFEPVEIRAMAEYLLAASQPVAASPSEKLAATPSMERGKSLFRTQGCLACHRHGDFREGQSTQGPDLSRFGALLRAPEAATWLASWMRDPSRHSPRTRMPNSMLEPAVAADIAAYLMASKGWEPKPVASLVDADLDELALLYLGKTCPPAQAEQYLREGIPASMTAAMPADAKELLAPLTAANARDKKLRYVGRRALRKRGCFGCHDVPGMENAQPIGPALSDWGRKPESQLAFEQVAAYCEKGDAASFVTACGGEGKEDGGKEEERDVKLAASPFSEADRAFYREAIESGRREGFLWQKLRAPRSFDYRKAGEKPYNEHLLMGRFALTDAEREAIIAFVLGLVAEPPKTRYVFQPNERGKAIVEGRKVLDQYGCRQCHTLQMERWTVEYDPAKFPAPPPMPEYDFLKPTIAADRVGASLKPNRRGLCRVELTGMPQVNAEGKPEETEDEDGNPQYSFTLWEPAAISGKVWPVGGAGVLVSPRQIVAKRLPLGGEFARLLYPAAVAQAKAAGSASAATEAWGWVPPALVHEGRIVQPAWLYEYLLEPSVIRPAAVLRMPRFTLSPSESRKLVDYFAAMAGVEFPYSSDARERSVRRGPQTPQQSERAKRAMRFVMDRTTYCAKCHLVGDFSPGGEIKTTLAPNLQDVARRIRPDYLRRWLASPKSVLPYTAMPVNFPPDQRMGQEIYPGPSVEQLDAVMDLLLNYDGYVKSRVSIREWIENGAKGK